MMPLEQASRDIQLWTTVQVKQRYALINPHPKRNLTMSEFNFTSDTIQKRYLKSKVRQAAQSLGLALQDALEEEKGIDLPEIQHHEDDHDYVLYVVIDNCIHPLHVFVIPEHEHVEWLYVISPSLPGLKDSVRFLYDGVIKERSEKLDKAIDNFLTYQEQP